MKTTNTRTIRLVQLALFTAIIAIMAFTPLGYIRLPGLSIALIVIPVTVGAILMGPLAGLILGGIFGLTSLIQCFGIDPFGTALFAINPLGTIILCMLPRILMGWLTGVIYQVVKKKDRTKFLSHMAANLAGPILNTVLFMSSLVIIFYRTEFIQGFATELGTSNVISFIILFVGINAVVEAVLCVLVGTAITRSLEVVLKS